jgi:hypothetical protein
MVTNMAKENRSIKTDYATKESGKITKDTASENYYSVRLKCMKVHSKMDSKTAMGFNTSKMETNTKVYIVWVNFMEKEHTTGPIGHITLVNLKME